METSAIYVEHIGLMWRGYKGLFERTGRVTVEVYPGREVHKRFTPESVAGIKDTSLVLANPAMLHHPGRNRLATNAKESFGDDLILLGWELPATAAPGASVTVTTAWRTGERQIEAAYAIGIYAFLDGVFLANIDGAPANGALQTFSLLPGYHFDDEKRLTMPATAGIYEIFVGVYDLETMERLPVGGREDSLYPVAGFACNRKGLCQASSLN